MCGITGVYDTHASRQALADRVARATRALAHRGPDAQATWLDPDVPLALGHTRLSVRDLSNAGAQPMLSPDGAHALVFNGEVYNFERLRSELARDGCRHAWRGTSDTEVLLAALARWGVPRTLALIDGMFAFAFWDRTHRTLWLARDRMGEKPLYYGTVQGRFVFGSELKSLVVALERGLPVREGALAEFLHYGYIGGARSVYAGIDKLAPGHYARAVLDDGVRMSPPKRYYEPPFASDGIEEAVPLNARGTALVDHADRLLRSVVRERLAADVPVGVFLSGGIDSSLVTALAQVERSAPVAAFTIGMTDPALDESSFARNIAEHLGVEFVTHVLGETEVRELVEQLPFVWDEPFADASQVPTLAVSRLARRHVTVSLSGDGADELFCGYSRYARGERLWRMFARWPRPARQLAARALAGPHASTWDRVGVLAARAPGVPRIDGERVGTLAQMLDSGSSVKLYQALVAQWSDPASVLLAPTAVPTLPVLGGEDFFAQAMGVDLRTYLPDDILVKVDRAAMAVGLETRAPFLAREVLELAAKLPADARRHAGQGKWLLRQVLARYVPSALFERPKRGFAFPVSQMLRTGLREWGEALLAGETLREAGFRPDVVRPLWAAHQAGRLDAHERLWPVLVWMQWRERWRAS